MNKKWTRLSLALALCGTNAFAGDMGYVQPVDWTGFYVGANAGYAWSANNSLRNISRVSYADPSFPLSQLRAESIAFVTTNRMFTSANSFMGGAQIGYNSQFSDNLVIGVETDLDALRFNSSATRTDTAPNILVGTYTSNSTMTKKLNYLGLLKGRLGYLVTQSFLIYGSGAFAYGGASLTTSYSVTHSQPNLLPFYGEASKNRILGGWSAGAGAEWMFTPCWSMKLEYLYYDLGTMHTYLNLGQSLASTPNVLYAGTIVESQAKYSGNAVRLGLNYRFA
jgi:outer membrane immunogenic protein